MSTPIRPASVRLRSLVPIHLLRCSPCRRLVRGARQVSAPGARGCSHCGNRGSICRGPQVHAARHGIKLRGDEPSHGRVRPIK